MLHRTELSYLLLSLLLVDGHIGSISVSGQLPTYPSPNPTLTLTCYQLTVVDPPHRYKDLQGKRELRRARKSIYIYISVDVVEVLPGCI